MLNTLISPLRADEDVFMIKDKTAKLEESFGSYNEALRFYENNLEEYDNLLFYVNDRLIMMEYGIVKFNTDEACSLEISYYSQSKDENDLLNGCYGIDGAYLETDYTRERVYFMISADRGYTSLDDVTLIPYEEVENGLSVYHNDEHFTHNIRSQLDYDFYSYSLELDDGLSFLGQGDYYSYDGHFFYDDFKKMIDDYRNESHENSVNEEAYFNYYQYLPHRSLTNYSSEDINAYLNDTLAIDGRLSHYDDSNNDQAGDEVNRCELYSNVEDFFIAESLYGTNAMMLFSSAMYESSYGRSLSSFKENNLYLTAAYLQDDEEKTSGYHSISDSIYSHSRYFISSRYANHHRSDYRGTFYGNKISGINVNYSPDQYFGEKSASMYHQLDSLMGYKDRNDKALGFIIGKDSVIFYHDEDLQKRWFSLSDISELSFVILEETEYSYRINIDSSLNEEYEYDFALSCAYVPREDIDLILNEDKIKDHEHTYIHYDLNGGEIQGKQEIDLLEGVPLKPYKEHYEFIGVDKNNVAQYRHIEAIDLIKPLASTVELGRPIELSGATIRVFYEDSTYKDVAVNTDMISGFENESPGEKQIKISYNGVSFDTSIEVSDELSESRNSLKKAITDRDYESIRNNPLKLRYQFSFDEIRDIDRELKEESRRNYYIDDRTTRFDISISGLELGMSDMDSLKYFGDTYYVIVKSIPYFDRSDLLKHSLGYGFEAVDGMNLSFRFNFENVELSSPIIVSVKIPDKKDDLIYTVYHLARNGDIIKMRTTQSDNCIQFLAKESGSYIFLSKKSANHYHLSDKAENLSYENMGIDNHRNNYGLFTIAVIALLGIIGVVFYYALYNRNERLWKEFRKSLRTQDTVPEEKPKS